MKKELFKVVVCAILAFSFCFSMAGCGGGSAAGMVVGTTEGVDSMNPIAAETMVSWEVFSLIYDPLVRYDESFEAQPCLAESWESNDDGTEWTFHLTDARWHDGEDVTSEDVKCTYELMASSYLYGLYMENIDKIECPDDKTVVIKCSDPKANMLQNPTPILPAHVWGDLGDEAMEYENADAIGTGPYKFASKDDTTVNLELNADYFGTAAKMPAYSFVEYKSEDGLASALKTGEVTGATNLTATQMGELEKEDGVDVIAGDANGFTHVAFNQSDSKDSKGNPALKEKVVRQAIELCTDKEAIVAKAYGGLGTPGTTLVNEGDKYHYTPQGDELRDFDTDRANKLLDEAGFVDTDGDGIREANGNKLEFNIISISDNTPEVKAAQIMKKGCKEAGIELNCETMDSGKMWDEEWVFNYDILIDGYGGDVDASCICGILRSDYYASDDNTNDFGYVNPEYDRLFNLQASQINEADRINTMKQLQKVAYDDCPMFILVYDNYVQAVRSDTIKGFKQIPENGAFFFNNTIDNYVNAELITE